MLRSMNRQIRYVSLIDVPIIGKYELGYARRVGPETETLAQLCAFCRIKQVRACKKYLLLSRERSFAIFWKYVCAMEKKATRSFFLRMVPCQQCLVQEQKMLNHWIKRKHKRLLFFMTHALNYP
jgi:hypothetical protein